jgi:predicted phosphodiesterase
MRIGVFSDVHANYLALEKVLAFFEQQLDLEFLVCLGDTVGYGPEPDRCCDAVRERTRFTVLGNHDAAVCGRMDYSYYYPAARNALDEHKAQLKPENMDWLRDLPYSVIKHGVCFTHGSPANEGSFEYVFTLEHALSLLDHEDRLSDITLMGHSHLTKSFRLPPRGVTEPVEELFGPVLDLSRAGKYVITVGSVGQPRDNDSRACCTVLDTEERTLAYHRLDYDVYGSAEDIWGRDYLAPDFGKRLFLGV